MQFRDLHKQYEFLKNDMKSAISRVLDDGRYISGAEVGVLEAQLSDYVGAKHCVTCGNGTDALTLALMAWGIGEGDAIFVPDFTFFATGEAPAFLGATPVFVDVEEDSFNINATKLEEAIVFIETKTELTPRVVIAVDLFGLPANYPGIREVCARHGLFLLEDGAQGFGGSIGDERACSFGDISTTSFFPAKPLGCYGDGGAIFTNNDEWADLLRSYAVHGKGSMKYDNVRIGMNSRLDTLQAAVLQVKLSAFTDYELTDINQVALWYREALADSGFSLPSIPEGYGSSWAQYTIRVPQGINRSALQLWLRDKGVPTMIYYPKPMHKQKAFAKNPYFVGGYPATETLCETVLSLPMHPYLEKASVAEVAHLLTSFEQ